MAVFKSKPWGADPPEVITVFGPVADAYHADPAWECIEPDAEPEQPAETPDPKPGRKPAEPKE